MPGFGELFLLGIAVAAVFGAKTLPRLADRLGNLLSPDSKSEQPPSED